MKYRKISLEDKELIDSYLSRYECYGSTYSMAYLNSWSYFDFDNMDISEEDDALIMRFHHKGKTHYLAELTSYENFPHIVDKIFEEDENAWIVQVESQYLNTLDKNKFDIDENINYDEYMYSPEDLIELKGKKYHGKRNHIKKFLTLYPNFVFRDYTKDDRDSVMGLFDAWVEDKEMEPDSERYVITNMLDHFEEFGLKACLLEVEGKLVGFTMGEVLASGVGIVHIEKCDTDYEGSYPTINKLFAEKYMKDVKYINRQEDVGVEGLRRAKRSYYPIRMSEKCIVRKKQD